MRYRLRILAASFFFASTAFSVSFASDDSSRLSVLSQHILQDKCAGIASDVQQLVGVEKIETVAVLYDRGCGVHQDMPHALRLYRQAIQQGRASLRARGYVDIYSGNSDSGIALLTQAAHMGDPFAPEILAFYFTTEADVDRADERLSRRWDETATNLGDMAGTAGLALDELTGYGGPTDESMGTKLLEKALAANDPGALLLRGYQLTYGVQGWSKDEDAGLSYYRKAIATGSAGAEMGLAHEIPDSEIIEHKITIAETVALARDAASRLLPKLDVNVFLGEVLVQNADEHGYALHNCAEAVPLLLPGTNFISPHPDMLLTMCYLYPLGIPTDRAKAQQFAEAAQRKGWAGAMTYLHGADTYYVATGDAAQTQMQRIRAYSQLQVLHPTTPGY